MDIYGEQHDVTAAITGNHLPASPVFSKAVVKYSHLLDWASWPPIQIGNTTEGNETLFSVHGGMKHRATYQLASSVLHLEEYRPFKGDSRSFSVRQEARFTVELSEPQDWVALSQQYILPLNDFLSFATFTASAFEEILVHPTSEPSDIMVPLVFRTLDMRRTSTESSLNTFDMLFTLQDATDSAKLLKAWFDLNSKYDPTVRQLLASQYAPFEWAENSFLAASRAAEAFYARRFKEQPYTQEQIDGLIGIIGEHVTNGDLQDFATRVIKRSNYFPQQDQYKKLLEYSGKAGDDILAIEPDFAKIVTEIRNRITHSSSRSNRGVVRRHQLKQALRWVVRACLLKELGFGDEQISTLLERNRHYDSEIHGLGPQQA
jgi:hypothetical protein